MTPDKAISIGDLKRVARRRLPKIIFDYIEGGAEDEAGIVRNEQRLRDILLVPRYLRDVSTPAQGVEILGQSFARPFGIAPTGMAAIAYADADLHLAKAAASAGAPFILSGASNSSIEKIAAVHPGAWYQIYLPKSEHIAEDLLKRMEVAGLSTLVVTVDVPAHSKRERSIRAGWVRPYKPTLAATLEAALHPAWVVRYLRDGLPYLENWQAYAETGASAMDVTGIFAREVPAIQTWDRLKRIREQWPGKLVVKGILHPQDALDAVAAGCDGIIVSNHGGRQFDRSPAPVEVFPAIHKAVGEATTLMLDSGITRGSDVVAAFCLGARMTFVGRATLYGVAAFGRAGADRALAILGREIELALSQIGCPSISELDESYLQHGNASASMTSAT
ncbi:alpha-hydroxy acid oxidase [Amorphus sp. 3PC139-8]|uniref:alpha-hydroxy acid oxidase n=1 Tax=Amorphus sp. 3PC139-8 TaxID=2735676 RepID=UPI00345C6B83